MEGVQNVAFSSFSDPIMLSSNFLGALEEEFRQMFWVRVFEALRRAMVAMAWSIYLCTRQALNFLALKQLKSLLDGHQGLKPAFAEWHIMVTHHIKPFFHSFGDAEHSLPLGVVTPWNPHELTGIPVVLHWCLYNISFPEFSTSLNFIINAN